MLYFSTSFEIRSRSSWLTTGNTTSALSSDAFSRICSSSLSSRTRENSRTCTGPLNWGVAAPAAKRAERIRSTPVRGQLIDARPVGGRRHEAARGEPAVGLGADEEVAARAAVDGELGEQRAVGAVVREHRRVRAVDLDAH